MQYRGEILPLVPLAELLGFGPGRASGDEEMLPVVVFNSGARRFGLIVDEITDIVEDTFEISSRSRRDGIVGSAVIGEKITDFLDLEYLLRELDKTWPGGQRDVLAKRSRVMVADSEPFSRGIVANYLEIHGCAVLQARDGRETIEQLAKEPVDVLLSSVELSDLTLPEVIRRISQNPSLGKLRVVGLTKGEVAPLAGGANGYADLISIHDRERLLESIAELAAAVGSERMEAGLAVA
jgi:two-component system chemotaxis sensor kinase CheA